MRDERDKEGSRPVITVDGEPVTGSRGDDPADITRKVRVELKCCKALIAMKPPHDLSAPLHARIVRLLRALRRHGTEDPDAVQAAGLSDEELGEAAAIVRALRAALPEQGYPGDTGFRAALGGYALDLVDEIEKRAGQSDGRPPGTTCSLTPPSASPATRS